MVRRKIDWESQIGRRLRLRDLHVFSMVVQCGSMAQAAARLGVSQPTVSEVISGLEHTFGVRLLDRSPQGIAPTMYGDALLKRSHAVFDELRQSSRDIEFLADPTMGELHIGCVETLSATLVPQVIRRFSQQYPRVVVHVDDWTAPAVELPGLRSRKYDLILVRSVVPLPDEHLADDLNVESLFDDQLVVAAGTHHRWARRRKIDLAELFDEPWIMAPPRTWNYSRLTDAFRARGLDMPKASVVTVSVSVRTRLLANGPFIAALPSSVLRLNLDHYALISLPVDLLNQPWPVVIVTLKNRTMSPVVERFIECTRGVAKSISAQPRARKS
jgi:DNA-binding transcriptional LysR family regulator